MKAGFKEWSVICRALATGRQILLLRKGGISEEGGEFQIDHREFLLFPTWSHQSPEQVVPDARALQQVAEAEKPDADQVVFSHYAVVTDASRVESLPVLQALRGHHIWADEVVEERFHRWRDGGVSVLIVRVYALPKPVAIEMTERYAGCKSWVDLDVDISTDGAVPVLNDDVFEGRRTAIQQVLAAS